MPVNDKMLCRHYSGTPRPANLCEKTYMVGRKNVFPEEICRMFNNPGIIIKDKG
ncbi:hypothetical protein DCCM_3982 [Desulfocucumis palustris]|uniref:Uncharacterized protein n=1 Tax=Desulfocucumis palustris TaxID=1898651 RepID=A0A2L2XFF5_9FIRM|nr:hypothetical protein DCCM_3982 [Desulfocucumis palustris]